MIDPLLQPRLARETLARALRIMPVVVVTGARQTGKSTLVETPIGPTPRHLLSLDDLLTRDRARNEPMTLAAEATPITIDEVQREPDLLLAIKRLVDLEGPRRTPGRFLLTGSANLLLMKRVSESLAGRAVYLTLWPMTHRERRGVDLSSRWSALLESKPADWPALLDQHPSEPLSWRDEVRRGGFPVPALTLSTDAARQSWFEGYIRTYLERDLRELSQVESLVDFRRLLGSAAHRIGQMINQTELGLDLQMSQQRVRGYLNLLEVSYQIIRLPAYSVSRGTRLLKTPKLYWVDAALGWYLSGGGDPTGAHLENLILGELLGWQSVQTRRPEICYWRTASQIEVDFVIDTGSRLLPIEVKSSRELTYRDARGLMAFREEYGSKAPGGIIAYDGPVTTWVAEGILGVPWWRL
jgi:predicted AAA+ superfamily ATPase